MRRFWWIVLAALFACLVPATAVAHMGHDRPKLEVGKRPPAPRDGPRGRAAVTLADGPLKLQRTADGSYVGGFELKNTGDGPLQIYRVAVRSEEEGGIRPPVGMGIQTLPKATAVLGPGESRLYNVVWRADQTPANQAFAQVVVVTDAAAPGAKEFDPPLFLGVVADRRPLIFRHVLSLAIFLPLLVAIGAVISRSRPTWGERALRLGASAFTVIPLALAAIPLLAFARGLGREGGNDGLQFIERFSLGGLDISFAVDGLTAPMLPIPALVLIAGIQGAKGGQVARFCLFAAPLATATVLLLASQTLIVLAVALVATALFAVMLGTARGEDGRLLPASARLLVAGVIASSAFLWLTHHLARAAPEVVSLDGKTTTTAALLPDVARELLHGHVAPGELLGLPLVNGIVALAIVCAAALSFAAPFHRLGADLAAELDAAHAALIVACLSLAGAFVLLRFGVLLSPDAARWASPAVAIVGLVTVLGAVASAAIEPDLRRLAGVLPAAAGGFSWLAASSLTPQGLQGAVAISVSRPLAAALLVLLAGALVSRTGEASLARWGGFGRTAPRMAGALLLALTSSACIPGGGAFWGAWLGLVGAVGRAPAIGLCFAIGLGASALVHARLWSLIAGRPEPSWEQSPALEPFGGKVPDLRLGSERAWAFVLIAPLVLLTLAPRSWLGVSNQVVLDALPYIDPPGPTQVATVSEPDAPKLPATFPG
ncbi:MAG: hypothetical protein HOV80_08435 [Polyangiaceae bacterium]|nr:hypothetical protein [Polyangiaceae bacterium]